MLLFYLLLIDSADDKVLFENIYNQNKQCMMACAMNILRNHDDAEDALQDAFLAIAKNFEKIKIIKENEVKFYLLTVTKNMAYNLFNKNKKHVQILDIDSCPDITDDSAFEKYITAENLEEIENAINAMSETYRDALFFHLVHDMSAKEIANMFNKKHETVKKQITRGKAMLAEYLKRGEIA